MKRIRTLSSRVGLSVGAGIVALLVGCGSPEAAPAVEAAAEPALPSEAPETSAAATPWTELSATETAEVLRSSNPVLVNVHIPYEGEIPGTELHLPYDEIERFTADLPADRNAPVLLYCRSGRMSRIAATTLASLGYTNLLHLDGGMIAWEAAELPLNRDEPAR
jgi:phage shock protein E